VEKRQISVNEPYYSADILWKCIKLGPPEGGKGAYQTHFDRLDGAAEESLVTSEPSEKFLF